MSSVKVRPGIEAREKKKSITSIFATWKTGFVTGELKLMVTKLVAVLNEVKPTRSVVAAVGLYTVE